MPYPFSCSKPRFGLSSRREEWRNYHESAPIESSEGFYPDRTYGRGCNRGSFGHCGSCFHEEIQSARANSRGDQLSFGVKTKQATYFLTYQHYASTNNFYPNDAPTHPDWEAQPWDISCPGGSENEKAWCALGASRPDSLGASFGGNPVGIGPLFNHQFLVMGWKPRWSLSDPTYINEPNRQWWYAIARGDLDQDGNSSSGSSPVRLLRSTTRPETRFSSELPLCPTLNRSLSSFVAPGDLQYVSPHPFIFLPHRSILTANATSSARMESVVGQLCDTTNGFPIDSEGGAKGRLSKWVERFWIRTEVLTEADEFKSGEAAPVPLHSGSRWKEDTRAPCGKTACTLSEAKKKARLAWNLAFNFCCVRRLLQQSRCENRRTFHANRHRVRSLIGYDHVARETFTGLSARASWLNTNATFMISAASVPASVIGVCGAPGGNTMKVARPFFAASPIGLLFSV